MIIIPRSGVLKKEEKLKNEEKKKKTVVARKIGSRLPAPARRLAH